MPVEHAVEVASIEGAALDAFAQLGLGQTLAEHAVP